MAKLSPKERAELEARLAEDDDDENDEVEIGWGDKRFRGSFRRARSVASAWGLSLDGKPASGDGGDKDDEEESKDKPARFAGRRIS